MILTLSRAPSCPPVLYYLHRPPYLLQLDHQPPRGMARCDRSSTGATRSHRALIAHRVEVANREARSNRKLGDDRASVLACVIFIHPTAVDNLRAHLVFSIEREPG